MREREGWPAVMCVAIDAATQQIWSDVRSSVLELDRIGVKMMTSYLVLYMSKGASLFEKGASLRLNLSPFGLLPHEIAALNAR